MKVLDEALAGIIQITIIDSPVIVMKTCRRKGASGEHSQPAVSVIWYFLDTLTCIHLIIMQIQLIHREIQDAYSFEIISFLIQLAWLICRLGTLVLV